MARNVAARAISVLLAGVSWAAADDSPPPLIPPALTPAADSGPAPTTKPAADPAPARIPESRPVLVVPGVTAPARVRTPPSVATSPPSTPGTPRELPQFDVPKEMLAPQPREIPRRPLAASPTPLVVESVPRGTPGDDSIRLTPRVDGSPLPATRRSAPRPAESPPPTPADAPRRPPGLLGRLFPAPLSVSRNPLPDRAPVTVEPRADPAADAALQRRVEKQVREAVGDRVRSYDVRVIDRNVTVRVRVTRFWQKRSIRTTLESLPALNGYHARVEVVD